MHYISLPTYPLHFPKILAHSKTIKNAEKLSILGQNNSRRLSNFLETRIFWKFDHISRIYNQIIKRNIRFAQVTIILIMIEQVLFLDIFSEKDPHLHAVEYEHMRFSLFYWKILSYGHRAVLPKFKISKWDCIQKYVIRLHCFQIKRKL